MKSRKIKNKIEFVLLLIVIAQIFLLFNMTFAYSYIIHQTDNLIKSSQIDREKNKFNNLINSGFTLLIGFLSIKQIGVVSAQTDVEEYCCADTCDSTINILGGALCPGGVTPIETSCDAIDDCKKGCCYDTEQGLCTENSPKGKCLDDGGKWDKDYSCSINNCVKGCCVLGSEPRFTTEKNCEFLSSQGYAKDFRDILNEPDCLALSATQSKGACIKWGVCSFTTEESCLLKGGFLGCKRLILW